MKKLYCITFFIFSFIISYAQSLNDLDRDPSFKGITIGAPISKYSNILVFSNVSQGKNVYRVKDGYYLSIFNVKMQDMRVVESNGKVCAIYLSKNILNIIKMNQVQLLNQLLKMVLWNFLINKLN